MSLPINSLQDRHAEAASQGQPPGTDWPDPFTQMPRPKNVAMLFIGPAAGMPDLAAFLPPPCRRSNAAGGGLFLPQP